MKYVILFLTLCACRGPAGQDGANGAPGVSPISKIPVPVSSPTCTVTPVDNGVIISCTNGILVHISADKDN